MLTHPSFDTIEAAVLAAAPELDDRGRRIALATYREVASGRPASTAAIARRAGVDPDVVTDQLAAWPGVFRDDSGAVVGFWGLAIPEMPHRVRAGAVDLHAWCAWDPLFLAYYLGDIEVGTADPITGERISYRIAADGTISELSHPDSVVSFLVPDGEWGDDVLSTFCHYVLQFTDRFSAERWLDSHPGTTVLTLADAAELGRRFAERVVGAEAR